MCNQTEFCDLFGFHYNTRSLLRGWFDKNPNRAACIITDIGYMTVLPPSMADEIRNDSRLSFTAFSSFQTEYPGFEAFRDGRLDKITLTVINKDLTNHLAKVTTPLAEETTQTLNELIGKITEWQTITLKDTILHLVARISSRHTTNEFMAGDLLRQWPEYMRPFVHWFITECQKLRSQGRCHPAPVYDAIEWFEEAAVAKGQSYDPAIAQLFFSTVAIHTTTDICSTKESQRMKPLQLASMQRVALNDVTLSDGTFIPKGTASCVSSHRLWDPKVYANPEQFGQGKHACSSRFFAANELQIALVHLLHDYEWKLLGKQATSVHDFGINPLLDPAIKMEIRARQKDTAQACRRSN
ncbi:cytochrome P450 [Truncatella angustata]|uniref:Cytochrome P450 n=1 Tax=Truncatella angustata TaxID=152316 RepID=A0A9P8ZV83_9PEZI|nr:cytochrome P450 [Truncatella angustata]KAH6652364.1 cytochrome P450 [Truncatella angustata]